MPQITGHYLPGQAKYSQSEVYNQLTSLNNYAKENDMKLNFKKTKLMLFNAVKSMDFMPNFQLDGHELEVVEEMKILGLILRTDMQWSSNTEHIVIKAFKKLWILRRLKKLGASYWMYLLNKFETY